VVSASVALSGRRYQEGCVRLAPLNSEPQGRVTMSLYSLGKPEPSGMSDTIIKP